LANPSVTFDGQARLQSLPDLVSDWLQLAEKDVFDNEQIPQSASGDFKGSLQGNVANLSFETLTAGRYKMNDARVKYTKAEQPLVSASVANLNGASVNLSGRLGDTKTFQADIRHANAHDAIKIAKPDFSSDSPALQKPLSFKSTISMTDNQVSLTDMVASLGAVKTTGAVTLNTGGNIPDIQAEMKFETLDTQSLLTGKTSKAASGGASSGTASGASTSAPWTRDAIDTSFFRSMNLDLKATAERLVHGTWSISNPVMNIVMKNGVLDIREVSGGLFSGNVSAKATLSAPAEGQPLDVKADINAQSVNLGDMVRALTSQQKERVAGTGDFNIDLTARGLSSSALVNSLNADGTLKTSEFVIKGLDLAKISEAISDESLTDLAQVVRGAFNNGQTAFVPINYPVTIREGVMPVKDFRIESDTAYILSNGEVNFARWFMDVTSSVMITKPEPLPEMTMSIKGPLNAPKQNVANDLVLSFIKNKYGAKLQKKLDDVLGDKLKDSPVGGLLNNLLGTPQRNTAPAPANDNQEVTPQQQQETEQQPQSQPKLEEELLKNLFDRF
jgi:hypothetical protein